jgi:hypothetical protein
MTPKITEAWLKEKSACSEVIVWFLGQKETEGVRVLRDLMKADTFQWANWLICRLMDKPNQVRYAIFAAECVLEIFEKKHPKDNRPRKAIEAAKSWLENPSNETKKADADAAAYAAYAARKEIQTKIFDYGIKLLEEMK